MKKAAEAMNIPTAFIAATILFLGLLGAANDNEPAIELSINVWRLDISDSPIDAALDISFLFDTPPVPRTLPFDGEVTDVAVVGKLKKTMKRNGQCLKQH
jgi:hypothetical protein